YNVYAGGVTGAGNGAGSITLASSPTASPSGFAAPFDTLNIVAGSDVLMVSELTGSVPVTDIDPTKAQANNASGFAAGDVAVISDCAQATVFKVGGVDASGWVSSDGGVNIQLGSVGAFEPDSAELSRLRTYIYYIGMGSNGAPALFRSYFLDGQSVLTNEELINDVETLQVEYG